MFHTSYTHMQFFPICTLEGYFVIIDTPGVIHDYSLKSVVSIGLYSLLCSFEGLEKSHFHEEQFHCPKKCLVLYLFITLS